MQMELPETARHERFGLEAMKFVNSPLGRSLRLRGLNARVLTPGTIAAGDQITVDRGGRLITAG